MSGLSRPERQWLDQDRKTADTPSRRLTSRIRKATDRWSLEASWVALGLASATVTIPPATRQHEKVGRKQGPSDPTAAVVYATLEDVSRSAERFAHLTSPCAMDGERSDSRGITHECPGPHAVDLGDTAGIHLDAETVVDGLIGTAPSSTVSFAHAVHHAADWHSTTSVQLLDLWLTAYRDGAESSTLDDWCSRTEDIARRLAGLAGHLAAWSGRMERTCACGCGRTAPPVGQGATRAECRKRHQRERQSCG